MIAPRSSGSGRSHGQRRGRRSRRSVPPLRRQRDEDATPRPGSAGSRRHDCGAACASVSGIPVTLKSSTSRKTGTSDRHPSVRGGERDHRPRRPSAATRRSSSGGETSPRGRSARFCRCAPGRPSRQRAACQPSPRRRSRRGRAPHPPTRAAHRARIGGDERERQREDEDECGLRLEEDEEGSIRVRCPAAAQLLVAPVLLLAGEACRGGTCRAGRPRSCRARRPARGGAVTRPRGART